MIWNNLKAKFQKLLGMNLKRQMLFLDYQSNIGNFHQRYKT